MRDKIFASSFLFQYSCYDFCVFLRRVAALAKILPVLFLRNFGSTQSASTNLKVALGEFRVALAFHRTDVARRMNQF